MRATHFLPATPPLPFSALFDRKERAAAFFPFSAPQSRWHFLGRNALWHGLRSLRLDEGDEVLVPAYNSGAEVAAVVAAGLSPRFFRICSALTPDIDDMQSSVSRRTRAVLSIHYFGFPQPLAELTAFCARNGLLLIEDCAPALFSCSGSRPLGSTGVFSIFSPHKTLPLPHGGLLVVNNSVAFPASELEELHPAYGADLLPGRLLDGVEMRYPEIISWLRRLRRGSGAGNGANGTSDAMHGESFDPATAGLGASDLVQQLALRTDPAAVVAARRRNYRLLASLLPPEGQLLPDLPEGVCPQYFPYLVPDRPAAIRRLHAGGINVFPHWARAHPAIPRGAFPEAEDLRARLLALPVYQGLSTEDIEYLASP